LCKQYVIKNEVPSDMAAVSLVSFDRGTAAMPVAQTELQATDTAAVARVELWNFRSRVLSLPGAKVP